jgi:peroxiredoxin
MATHDDPELDRWEEDGPAAPDPESEPDDDGGPGERQAGRTGRGGGPPVGTWLVAGGVVVWLVVLLVPVEQIWQGNQPATAAAAIDPRVRESPHGGDDAGAGGSLSGRPDPTGPRLTPIESREAAPSFTLPDADGGDAALADYGGQVLLLNFWATWCHPCRAEMPWFVAYQDVFSDRGFSVLGVSLDEPGWDIVRPFLERSPVNYRIALADTAERIAPFGPLSILPTTWLIDRHGRVAAEHIGLVDRASIEAEIRLLLDEQ